MATSVRPSTDAMRAGAPFAIAAAVAAIAPAGAAGAFPHVVAPGESLSSVAASDGLSVEQLAAANGLSIESQLIAGSTLLIPAQETGVAAPEEGAGEAASAGVYVVQPGDTLSAIAARAGTAVDELAAINGIDPSGTLLAGSRLKLPGASSEATGALSPSPEAPQAGSSQPVGAQAEGSEAAPPYTTEETVSASEVGAIAAENGVPAALAEAVADQESGFNNALTSGADARGVMQVTPGTWSWIGEALAGSQPLAPASAASNIRAGVLLLHSLLEATGGDEALAVAGYYQGLPSVLQEGETAETEQYVASVLALREQFGGG